MEILDSGQTSKDILLPEDGIIYTDEETDKKIEEVVNKLYEEYRKVGDKQILVNEYSRLDKEFWKHNSNEKPILSSRYYSHRDVPSLLGCIAVELFAKDRSNHNLFFGAFKKGYAVAYILEQEHLKELEEHGNIGFVSD